MKRVLLLIVATVFATVAYARNNAVVDIVPRPVSVVLSEGEFTFDSKTSVVISTPELMGVAAIFADDVAPFLGKKPTVADRAGKRAIRLSTDASLADEQYTLTVSKSGVGICGGSPKAVFYGLQSLRQLVVSNVDVKGRVVLPAMTIEDKPHFAHRGAMLDVCRHIFTVEEVKKYIDILSLHKINRFHWHLTEDQGWRIEIKRYPELTRVGSMRDQTLVGRYRKSELYDGTPYGGYFTQEQVREIVAYAAERYIEVIPEIEMPGHAVAALTSYPHLGCTGGPYNVRTTWGISKEVFCAGKESTFEFVENVLAEVMELFPSKYIHIGGDECPKDAWKACPLCQQRIADEGLANENELQSYFVSRVCSYLASHGRKVIGWDEIMQGGNIPKDATIMSWRGKKGGLAAARDGYDVIMTPNTHCYIDYYQTSDHEANNEPLGNGRFPVNVRKVYGLDPYEGLSEEQCKHITGVQVNLWTEYIATFDHVQHMLLPRLAALAEVGWSYERRDYDDFGRRMHSLRKIYDKAGYNYAPYFFNGIE